MTNPLSLIRKLDASSPRATRLSRQKPRRDRRAAVKATVRAAKVNAPK